MHQGFWKPSNEVLDYRSIVSDLNSRGFSGWGLRFLLQFLDLGPDTLVGAQRFLKCASLQIPLLNRPHNAFRPPAELGELAPPIGNLRFGQGRRANESRPPRQTQNFS